MQWLCPRGPSDPAVAGDAAQGRRDRPVTPPVSTSAVLWGEDEDFGAGVLNLHMFCSSPGMLDVVVAAAGALWHVVTRTLEFARLKIRKVGHPVPGICIVMHHYFIRQLERDHY